jgi:hypothetical protein
MLAQGIPEPSLIMYGVIRNVGDGNIRLISGTLTWQFQPSSGGAAVTVTTRLTNINDQFSYILRVPWETDIGSGLSSNTLRLISASISYNRSQVYFGTNQAAFAQPTQATFSASSRDRGRIERVDLQVSISCFDTDGNGLCDWWEQQFFGRLGINPNGDDDGDGLTNLLEYKAGTDPADPNSVFKFISTAANPAGGVRVEWSSVDGRLYTLQRSTDLLTGFTDIVANIPATEPKNSYLDTNAVPPAPYFYRLRLQP